MQLAENLKWRYATTKFGPSEIFGPEAYDHLPGLSETGLTPSVAVTIRYRFPEDHSQCRKKVRKYPGDLFIEL